MQDKTNISIYVISLARAAERRAIITKRLTAADVDYEIVDAVDGKDLDLIKLKHRLKVKNAEKKRGEVGCFLSHYNLWQRMADQKIPHAVILEDDAEWDDDFFTVINKLPKSEWEWDVVNLMYKNRVRIETLLCNIGNRRMVRTVRPTSSMIGYAVSLTGANKLLKHCVNIREQIDVQWREYWINHLDFYCIDPPIGYQSGAPSTIGHDNTGKPIKKKYDFKKTMGRLYRKIRRALYHWTHPPRIRK